MKTTRWRSLIFAFMIIGFIAAENILLYKGILFYLGLEDKLFNQIIIYGLFTLVWILLTAYGFRLVTRVSSGMVIGFLIVLLYMLFVIVVASEQPWAELMFFDAQVSVATLEETGLTNDITKLIFCINILAGSAGALALTNIMDALFGWKPGRIVFVVAANLLSLLFLYGEIISWFKSFLIILSILTMSFSGIMLADYFIVKRWLSRTNSLPRDVQRVNRAGVITIICSFVLSHYVLNRIIPIEFVTAIMVSLLLYPVLSLLFAAAEHRGDK